MRSTTPKPLHRLAGRPMFDYVADAARSIDPAIMAVVLSPELYAHNGLLSHLQSLFGERLAVVVQGEPTGTGSALQMAAPLLTDASTVVVLFADHPLLTESEIAMLLEDRPDAEKPITLLTCLLPDAAGYGRIARNANGHVQRIVERRDDNPADRIG